MTIKDILVHLSPGDGASSADAFALQLAERTGAHVTAAAVALDLPLPAPDPSSLRPDWGLADYDAFTKVSKMRRAAAEQSYQRFALAAPGDVQTEFVLIQAFREKARDDFARLARHFDLLVIAASGEALEAGEDNRDLITGALFGSGRPIFIVPAAPAGSLRLEKALVCWDGGVQAARALAESLPLLTRAQDVEVVCVTEETNGLKGLPGFGIAQHLARHGISATLREIASAKDAGSAILDHARDIGADFLVMGGYGHWRISELVLGGATRTILASSPLPVIMAH